MKHLQLNFKNGIAWIEWDQKDSKANVLSEEAFKELSQIVDQINDSQTSVACIVSKKPSIFIAGADLKEIKSLKTAQEFSEKIDQAHQVLKKIENSSCTFVSALDGVCLGGGTELILACDYRIATLRSKIGLPEVNLGLIPGFGGCVRLPRLIGFYKALNLILTGQAIAAKKAHRMGLVNQIFNDFELESHVSELAQKIQKGTRPKKKSFHKDRKFLDILLESYPIRSVFVWVTRKQVLRKTKGFYPAPLEALKLVHRIDSWSLDKALKEEKKIFCQLAPEPIHRNLVRIFFLTEKVKKQTGFPNNEKRKLKAFQKIGVLGAGVMGSGVAYMCASKDFKVRLQDLNETSLLKAQKTIHSLFSKQVKRKKIHSFEKNSLQANVQYSMNPQGLKSMDMVIEAIVEDMDIKKKVIRDTSQYMNDEAIFATNTSSLSVTEMSQAYKNPAHFIGMHFFNPVHRMPLVEVIRGDQTNDETVAKIFQLAQKLGKFPVIVKDRPGFLVNRLLMPWLSEALWMWGEGMKVRTLDDIFSKNFGFPMGPFRLMDEVGLDVCVKVIQSFLNAGLNLSVPPFISSLAQEKCLGKKTFLGFYHYTDKGQARSVHKELENQFCSSLKSKHSFDQQTALERGLYRMVNEASFVLEEEIVKQADSVDLAMIMGAGFPPFRGGLLRYADTIGLHQIYQKLSSWNQKGWSRFNPSSLLKEKKQFLN